METYNMSWEQGYHHIRVERDGDVLVLTLDRPERLNAINAELHGELARIFGDADRDADSRVVVITGAGRAFSAGGDVSDMASDAGSVDRGQGSRVRGEGHQVLDSLLAMEKPIISMVNGPAIGLGATIALCCDVVIAASDAQIGDTHVKVGLVAGDGGAVIWPLLVGVNRAKQFLMTGELLSGDAAYALGLVNSAVPAEELRTVTFEMAHKLAAQVPFAVRATKVAVNRVLRRQVLEMMDIGLAWEERSMESPDHREAARAFVERRAPHFGSKP
jgi:enoyl-CoA hydratase